MTQSGIEPVTFRFVAQYLNHCATISGPPLTVVYLIFDLMEAETSPLKPRAATPFDQVRLLFDKTELFLSHLFF
jgi:hypothetical protein